MCVCVCVCAAVFGRSFCSPGFARCGYPSSQLFLLLADGVEVGAVVSFCHCFASC